MIPAIKELPAEFYRVMATDKGEAVRNFRAAHDRQTGNEDLCPQAGVPGDVQSNLAGYVRDDVESGVVELHLQGILHGLAKEVIPSPLDRVVVGMNRAAAREPSKGVHVRRFLAVVRIVVAEEKLVLVVEMMV